MPIVPVGFRSHTAPVLLRSSVLTWLYVWPRVLGMKRYCITRLAVVGAALILGLVPMDCASSVDDVQRAVTALLE